MCVIAAVSERVVSRAVVCAAAIPARNTKSARTKRESRVTFFHREGMVEVRFARRKRLYVKQRRNGRSLALAWQIDTGRSLRSLGGILQRGRVAYRLGCHV